MKFIILGLILICLLTGRWAYSQPREIVQTVSVSSVSHIELPVYVGTLKVNGVRTAGGGFVHTGWETLNDIASHRNSLHRIPFSADPESRAVVEVQWVEVVSGNAFRASLEINSADARFSRQWEIGNVAVTFGTLISVKLR